MTTSAPPPAPPAERFWERYNPRHEFPLSGVGSVALHISGIVLVLLALWLLSRVTISDRSPVPISVVKLVGTDDPSGPGPGARDGVGREEDPPSARPPAPKAPPPDPSVPAPDLSEWLPKVPPGVDGPRPDDLKVPDQIARNFDRIRELLPQPGGGGSKGSDPKGGDAAAAKRAVRWELNFRTADGTDYLKQLTALKATLAIPQPTDWKTFKAYKDLAPGRATGEAFRRDDLPALFFIDDTPESAGRLARALGLDYSPPLFMAFFPKDIEEELARKEREYRGRKENEIFSTSFKILVRDGKPVITVIGQEPVRR